MKVILETFLLNNLCIYVFIAIPVSNMVIGG